MPQRWGVSVFYRLDEDQVVGSCSEFEEFHELHDLIELGPDWNTIDRIEVRLLREIGPRQTLRTSAEGGDTHAQELIGRH